jgi:hypothetical protein
MRQVYTPPPVLLLRIGIRRDRFVSQYLRNTLEALMRDDAARFDFDFIGWDGSGCN